MPTTPQEVANYVNGLDGYTATVSGEDVTVTHSGKTAKALRRGGIYMFMDTSGNLTDLSIGQSNTPAKILATLKREADL
ncbi:hypothetical protein BIV57_17900 [Mangrovactinospora gilvigrisea]|uniref:Uncharacterized protein n=1 Tax=Mangrovactinospora gilvigrisea TaxID=1428644 RepID=A0A1J7BBQ1_9ACTN|nr:hypothetical protein [Mangrovactinospora gilvigrisea]OIV36111.1 hypothetical protein BIV57_17900 [Mangrovactinospora gilvigrisea]